LPKLLLIDGAAIAYRAHYGLAGAGLTTTSGESTAATYGYVSTIWKLLRDEKPDYVCVALDTDKPTYRHDLFEEYKAGRPEMPEDLAAQLEWMREITEALGIPVLEAEGFEADDIIGTLSSRAVRKGIKVVVATGDKDMLQLVNDSTRVIMLSGAGRDTKVFSEKTVETKFGLPPALLPDYFGLMGDAIDNIPGVRGIGEKTARALVSAHGTIEQIYGSLKAVEPPRVRKILEDNRDQAFASLELVKIRTDVPLERGLEDLKYREMDAERLTRIFKKLDFRKLLRKIVTQEPAPGPEPIIWQGLGGGSGRVLECGGRIAVEVNAGMQAEGGETLLGAAISCEGGNDYYFPLRHKEPGNVPAGEFVEFAGEALGSRDVPVVAHDAKRVMVTLSRLGIELGGLEFDSLLARYLLNPGQSSNSLADIALDYRGEVWAGEGKKKEAALATVAEASRECTKRTRTLLAVRDTLAHDLDEAGLTGLYREIEMPLVGVLAGMEIRGIRVDTDMLAELSDRLDKELHGHLKDAFALAGREFNLNSPKDVARVLFDEIGLKPVKKTKTGYSTDLSVLTQLAQDHELPRKILDYRQVSKLKTTYVDQLIRFADPRTGRIHAHFNQAVTATGRLSSSDPNLQNIPIRGEAGGEIRKAFIPSGPDWVFVSADYSQIELRILAHLSGDPALTEAFKKGEDIHTQTAAFVFKVPPAEVTREMRIIAKAVNFGVIYGMGVQALARTTDLPVKEAKAFLDEHRQTYPAVYEYIQKVIEEASERGFVETILGRRRYLPNIVSDNAPLRSATERMAVNTPVQGSAADLIKAAMLRVSRRIEEDGLRGGIVIQVHDDILIDCPLAEKDRMSEILEQEMGGAYDLDVPLKVDLSSGANWYETH
jgi:DNA polymerase-1